MRNGAIRSGPDSCRDCCRPAPIASPMRRMMRAWPRSPLRSAAIASRATARRRRRTSNCCLSNELDGEDLSRMAEAAALARDLINIPANDMGPQELAECGARACGSVRRKILLHRRRGAAGQELSAHSCRRQGFDPRAAADRLHLGRGFASEGDAGRQGRLLRYRRRRPEAVERHADHEEGHGRRGQRAGARADDHGCEAEGTAARADSGGRERGRRQRVSSARHLSVAQGADGGDRQHRCRRAAGARRCAGAGGRGEAGPADRSRHA